jgi:hypothetical protein
VVARRQSAVRAHRRLVAIDLELVGEVAGVTLLWESAAIDDANQRLLVGNVG